MHGEQLFGRRQGTKYMDADEIESILRIQWKSLHSGSPYLEDYYYQVWNPLSLLIAHGLGEALAFVQSVV